MDDSVSYVKRGVGEGEKAMPIGSSRVRLVLVFFSEAVHVFKRNGWTRRTAGSDDRISSRSTRALFVDGDEGVEKNKEDLDGDACIADFLGGIDLVVCGDGLLVMFVRCLLDKGER